MVDQHIALQRVDPNRDADEIAALHRRTRDFMAPFAPDRSDEFYTPAGLRDRLRAAHAEHGDRLVDWLILLDGSAVGTIAISNIARGPFQSANLGYMVEEQHNCKGIATCAVGLAQEAAFVELGLHRLEAGTLVDNVGSQRVLEKSGFIRIGISPRYLHIAGDWRDHVLFAKTADV